MRFDHCKGHNEAEECEGGLTAAVDSLADAIRAVVANEIRAAVGVANSRSRYLNKDSVSGDATLKADPC